jgi:hypothetical protein
LAQFTRVLGVLPFLPEAAAIPPRRHVLAAWVERHLDTETLWHVLTTPGHPAYGGTSRLKVISPVRD